MSDRCLIFVDCKFFSCPLTGTVQGGQLKLVHFFLIYDCKILLFVFLCNHHDHRLSNYEKHYKKNLITTKSFSQFSTFVLLEWKLGSEKIYFCILNLFKLHSICSSHFKMYQLVKVVRGRTLMRQKKKGKKMFSSLVSVYFLNS